MNMDYQYAARLVTQAGAIMMSSLSENQIHVKGRADFVTDIDMEVQRFLYERLQQYYPHVGFMGEEEQTCDNQGELLWILDPIDGTTNYIYGYNMSAISLGLKYKNEIIFGIVYNPFTDEFFMAEKGKGAYLNSRPIHVSRKTSLQQSLVAFGTSPYEKHRAPGIFEKVLKIYQQSLDVRRTGSAALDLAYIACGRQDAFFEYNLKAWDIAAGCLLVQEAGGIVRTPDNREIIHGQNNDILACANSLVLEDMLHILK